VSTPLRVLILEDRLSDAELMLHELRQTGFKPEWQRVETEQDYLAHLEPGLDIILADYRLPQFDAARALEMLQSRELDIPFIVVTGVLGDELAVELMKLGATDYLLKDRLGRLGPGVLRALEQKKLRDERRARVSELSALYSIATMVNESLDLDFILSSVIHKIKEIFDFDAASVHLNDDVKRVFETGDPLIFEDIQSDVGYRKLAYQSGLQGHCNVPLEVKGKTLGVINFFSKKTRHLSPSELKLLQSIAGHASSAVENARLFEETKKQAIELEKSNNVKSEFLNVISHEFRTPLNVIMGFTGMMEDGILGKINGKQEEALRKVLDQSRVLLAMINDVLEVTRIEADQINVEKNDLLNLSEFFDDLKSNYGFPLNKDLILTWDYGCGLPKIKTDSKKLKRILENLINNAIKFTKKGSVTITVRYFPDTKRAYFKVTDTGIGIPKEALPVIFKKFRQIDSSDTRLYGGVGLGLFIVKQFTELLGGTVTVETEPGMGSTFGVTIPVDLEVTAPGMVEEPKISKASCLPSS